MTDNELRAQTRIEYRNKLWKLADVAWHVGMAHTGEEGRSHAMHREELLDRLADEHMALLDRCEAAEAAYDRLTGLLKQRFPPRADGSYPDWAIEDVLAENETLKARVAELESALRSIRDKSISGHWTWVVADTALQFESIEAAMRGKEQTDA